MSTIEQCGLNDEEANFGRLPPPPFSEFMKSQRSLLLEIEPAEVEVPEDYPSVVNEIVQEQDCYHPQQTESSPTMDNHPRHNFATIQSRYYEKSKRRTTNLAGGVNLNRIAAHYDSMHFSTESIQRAVMWTPSPGDVILASSPSSGEAILERMVRLLCASTTEEFERILSQPQETAPWIECALVDDDPSILNRPQPGSTNRIFRTAMAHSMLSMKMTTTSSKARFIGFFRNPLHLRAVFFEQLKQTFVRMQQETSLQRDEEQIIDQFDEALSVDAVATIPITLVQTTFHSHTQKFEYENNIREWLAAAQKKSTREAASSSSMVLFFEELVSAPKRTLLKLAEFLQKEVDDATMDRIISATFSQRSLEELSLEHSPIVPSICLHEWDADPVKHLIDSMERLHGMSPKGVLLIRACFADVFSSRAKTYEQLYESLVRFQYPKVKTLVRETSTRSSRYSKQRCTLDSKRKSVRRAMTAEVFKSEESDASTVSDAGPNRSMSKEQPLACDDRNNSDLDDSEAIFASAARNRGTTSSTKRLTGIISRLFGSSVSSRS